MLSVYFIIYIAVIFGLCAVLFAFLTGRFQKAVAAGSMHSQKHNVSNSLPPDFKKYIVRRDSYSRTNEMYDPKQPAYLVVFSKPNSDDEIRTYDEFVENYSII